MMWFSGYKEPLDVEETPIYIGLATSQDGFICERSLHNPVLALLIPEACITYELLSLTLYSWIMEAC
jgi:hypothetical protein